MFTFSKSPEHDTKRLQNNHTHICTSYIGPLWLHSLLSTTSFYQNCWKRHILKILEIDAIIMYYKWLHRHFSFYLHHHWINLPLKAQIIWLWLKILGGFMSRHPALCTQQYDILEMPSSICWATAIVHPVWLTKLCQSNTNNDVTGWEVYWSTRPLIYFILPAGPFHFVNGVCATKAWHLLANLKKGFCSLCGCGSSRETVQLHRVHSAFLLNTISSLVKGSQEFPAQEAVGNLPHRVLFPEE